MICVADRGRVVGYRHRTRRIAEFKSPRRLKILRRSAPLDDSALKRSVMQNSLGTVVGKHPNEGICPVLFNVRFTGHQNRNAYQKQGWKPSRFAHSRQSKTNLGLLQ